MCKYIYIYIHKKSINLTHVQEKWVLKIEEKERWVVEIEHKEETWRWRR